MPLDILLRYWEVGVGFLGVFLLAFWTFDEKDQSDSIGDTIERVGERAQTATGGLVGAAGSIAVVLLSVLWTIGDQLVMSGLEIVSIIGMDPVLSGGIGSAVLGTLGISGAISIEPWQFGIVAFGVIGIGVIWRARD